MSGISRRNEEGHGFRVQLVEAKGGHESCVGEQRMQTRFGQELLRRPYPGWKIRQLQWLGEVLRGRLAPQGGC